MFLTIGETAFEVTDCVQRRDNKKGYFLDIIVSVDNIGMDALRAILKDNKEDIILTKDDGKVNTYSGFGLLGKFSCEDDVMQVAQYANSEIEAQLSAAQNKVAEQAQEMAVMQETINKQAEIIVEHGTVINNQAQVIETQATQIKEQADLIKTQTEQVETLADMSAAQLSSIDSILSEVVPSIIDLAVMQAVEAVQNSGTEGTEEDEELEYYSNLEQEAYEEMIDNEVTTGESSDVIEE